MPKAKEAVQEGAVTIIPADPDNETPGFEILDRTRGPSPRPDPVQVPSNAPSITVTDEDTDVETVVRFKESEDMLDVAISFEIPKFPPFTIKLINMSWQLMEDIDDIQHAPKEQQNISMLTSFFHEYVDGGPRSVPIAHTRTVFECIKAYMTYKSDQSLGN